MAKHNNFENLLYVYWVLNIHYIYIERQDHIYIQRFTEFSGNSRILRDLKLLKPSRAPQEVSLLDYRLYFDLITITNGKYFVWTRLFCAIFTVFLYIQNTIGFIFIILCTIWNAFGSRGCVCTNKFYRDNDQTQTQKNFNGIGWWHNTQVVTLLLHCIWVNDAMKRFVGFCISSAEEELCFLT